MSVGVRGSSAPLTDQLPLDKALPSISAPDLLPVRMVKLDKLLNDRRHRVFVRSRSSRASLMDVIDDSTLQFSHFHLHAIVFDRGKVDLSGSRPGEPISEVVTRRGSHLEIAGWG